MMKAMNCQTCRSEIEEANLRQRLSDQARAHLSACAPCHLFEQERHALREMLASVETVTAPPDFDWKLRARINATKNAGQRRFARFNFAPGMTAIALAASFALLVSAAVAFKQLRSGGNENSRSAKVSTVKTTDSATKDEGATQPTADTPTVTKGVEEAVNVPDVNTGDIKKAKARRPSGFYVQKASAASIATRNNDFGNSGAKVVRGAGVNDAESSALIAVEVRASTEPARLLVGDERGATRTVSLEPVSFGAQDMIDRRDAARLSSPASRGVW
jgi:hypothetical protein